ncbi:hypothetical protein Tsubulata_012414 [Turnera subulata]|uniref:DNA-directed RNA polymerase III subunit RPC9 n=1 Tax=Turnera subulata TaxID=218843 RepID=A0A9Q0GIH2_9ROSI|nr:hypothetical protein Tsubulata_012414 [Turnera subulata]
MTTELENHAAVHVSVVAGGWVFRFEAAGVELSVAGGFEKNPNAGALTNFEVLDFLVSRGASKDSSRVIAPIEPSEYQVYDYLVKTVSSDLTREHVHEFLDKCKKYDLAKADILNIINIRPSQCVHLFPIVEQCEERFGDEEMKALVKLIKQIFPAPPGNPDCEEPIDEGQEEVAEGEEVNEDSKEAIGGEQMEEDPKEVVRGEED